MSTSSDGSVNGKNDGRKRILTLSTQKCLAEFFENPFQVTEVRTSIDDQAFDLVEHRRVRLIESLR
jgi:hypothetical protein